MRSRFFLSLFVPFVFGWTTVVRAVTVDKSGASYGLVDRFRGASIPGVINGIVRFALGAVGIYFLIIFLWGAVLWMTAGGSDRTKKAKQKLTGAVIGICIVVFSYIIVTAVLGIIGRVASGS